jgi:hypothetical protein
MQLSDLRFDFILTFLNSGVTPNTIIDSNDEPPGNNQQRIIARNY